MVGRLELIHSSRVHQDSLLVEFKYLFFSHLKVQLILPFLLKWSFAFFILIIYSDIWLWYNFTSSFEMFLISPHQAYSFVVDFLNNSIQSVLLSSFHSILSILPEALHCSSRQVQSLWVKFMFYPFHVSAGVLLKSFQSYSFLISF